MPNSHDIAVDWLRTEFATEQASGFGRLARVPETRVIRFLDRFAGLGPDEQSALVAVLADWASYRLTKTPLPQATYEQFSRATAFPDRAAGIRYTGVTLLAGLAKSPGGVAGWLQTMGAAGQALQPPAGLLPDLADLVPVKIPSLRQMVASAFADRFVAQITEIGDGIWRYDGTLAASTLKIMIRYSAKMGPPQLQYEVAVRGNGRVIDGPNLCFETLLGAGFGMWDYLTKENAERSVELLCEVVEYMAHLPERLPEGICQR